MVEFLKKQIWGFSGATSYKRGDARGRERVAFPLSASPHPRSLARSLDCTLSYDLFHRKPPGTKADFFPQRQTVSVEICLKNFRTSPGSAKLYALFCIKEKQWGGHPEGFGALPYQQLLRKSVTIEKQVRYVFAHTFHDATTDCVQFLIILVILLVFVYDPTDWVTNLSPSASPRLCDVYGHRPSSIIQNPSSWC